MRLSLAAPLLLAAGAAAAAPLSNPRQLTFEGKRAGEGYFSADGRKMIFQSEREPGNPFFQMYLLDLESGDVERLSTGTGKTTCGWLHPDGTRALFASTQMDPDAAAKQQAELDFRASGQSRRYAWDFDLEFDLVERTLATGAFRVLAPAKGYDAEGAWSPDGARIAFASNRHAYEGGLTPEEEARLGSEPMAFMDIYTMDAEGGDIRRLTDAPGYDGGVFWSADGTKLTWRRFSPDGASAEIWTMNADGTGQRPLTSLGALSWAPFFHPSGDYLIFATNLQGFANFELYLVDADGAREPVRVTERDGFDGLPAFAPDGRTLAWTSNATPDKSSQIFRADWDDAAARALLAAAPLRAAAAPVTSPEIAVADLKAQVEALTAEAMAGRLTGTEGERLATAHVAAALERMGLAPAGTDGFFEPFEFTAGVSLGSANALSLSLDGVAAPVPAGAWTPLAFSGAPAGGVSGGGAKPTMRSLAAAKPEATKEAPVALVGYGLSAPAEGAHPARDSYGDLDLTGKWALIWRGLPGGIGAEERQRLARHADLRYKASVAKSRGALGVIFAPPPRLAGEQGLPELSYESVSGEAGLPVVAVDGATAARMLAKLADLAEVEAAAERGEAAPRDLIGVAAVATVDLAFETRTGRSVLARLDLDGRAADDPAALPPLYLGGHVDHLGRGEASGSLAREGERGTIHHGADDNASGVAAMLEAAEWLAAERAAGRLTGARDIVFAAWSGEELGLIGATRHVEALIARRGAKDLSDLVSAYLNLDMVGRLRDNLVISGLGSSPVWAREVERRNAVVGLPVVTQQDAYLPTDSTAFYLRGAPILAFFTGAHEDYHRPTDTAEKLNYEGLRDIARLVALVARSRAVDPEEPPHVETVRPDAGARRVSGVFLGTIPDYATEGRKGVPISGVVKGGPAEAAGLKGGDAIVGLGGDDLANIYDFVRALNGLKAGEETAIAVERAGERIELRITPRLRD